MAELKTKKNTADVYAFIDQIADERKRNDSHALLKLFTEITGEEPVMWGDSIIGFGHYHYKYPTGREGDWFITGFSPRKQNISIYLNYGFEQMKEMKELGKYKTGKACLYVKHLGEISIPVLEAMIRKTYAGK
jgi:hypothetical protein